MAMATVYRVEDEEGEGPYRGSRVDFQMVYEHIGPRWPGSSNDGIVATENDPDYWSHQFGFACMSQLVEWFDGWMDDLNDHNLHVTTYEVPEEHIRLGGHQLTFNYTHAKAVDRNPLPTDSIGAVMARAAEELGTKWLGRNA